MDLRDGFLLSPVLVLITGQLSSYHAKIGHLLLKIVDLVLDVGQQQVEFLHRDREPQRGPLRGTSALRLVNHIPWQRREPDHLVSVRLDHGALLPCWSVIVQETV